MTAQTTVDSMTDTAVSPQQRSDLEDFVVLEAGLADSGRYEEWLGLWAEGDIEYWVPCNSDDGNPASSIAIIYDDRVHMEERIARMVHRFAHTFTGEDRHQRVVGSLQFAQQADEFIVRSTFILGSLHRGQQKVWFGRSIHRLIQTAEGRFRMRAKKVMLLNNDEALPNILFLP
ncbi:MAG: benzoate transporter [Gammaproteobacteria bacterium]|nr:MAG: benzoate transporter [Gammaproteobacteria bacterium]